ncbi:MAG: ATP-binding protein [Planctomycetota bacterium]
MARPQPQRGSEAAKITIASDLKLVKVVRRFVTDQCAQAGFEERKLNELALAVSELCDNAIEHGTKDEAAQIFVEVTFKNDRVRVSVRDSGGHSRHDARLHEAVQSIEDVPEAEAIRGRGLFLVNALVDRISLQRLPNGGTEIAIEKAK